MPVNKYGQMIGEDLSNWQPRSLPPKSPIHGIYCRLEPIDALRHGDGLYLAHSAADNDMLWTYLLQEKPATKAELLAMLNKFAASNDPLHFAVVEQKSGKALGSLSLMRIDAANGVIETGHINFSVLLQHTTPATEAVYLLLNHVFTELGYRRCEWKCDNFNEASKRAALRFGFNFEGVFAQALVSKGRNRDTAWFAITDKQWPRLQKGFKRWLAPANFDHTGRQKSKLVFERP